MKLLQTVSGARGGGSGRGGSGSGGSGQQQRDGVMMRIEGTNPHADVVGLGLTKQEEQEKQQQQQQQDDDKEEREDHAGRGRDGIMAQVSPNSLEQGEATAPSSSSITLTKPPLAPFTYGAFIKILDFSQLHYILSDTFLSHLLPHTPSLQQLIIDSPKQFSDDSLFTLAEYCCNLVRLELLGCVRVSDKGMEAVFEKCWKLKKVVLSNVVGSEVDEDGVGNSSKASSSNHSLTLTHKTIDHLAVTSPPSKDSTTTTTIVRKLHTLNLANGLRFPTSGEIDSASSQSLSNLIRTYSTTLVSLNLSFCGLAVTDTLLLQFSSTVQSLPLQHLDIAFCFDVTDTGLVSLSEACPDLQDLDITGLTQVSDKSILAIGQGCMKFRRLVMVDERHRSNPGGSVGRGGGGGGGGGSGGGGGGQWSSQNPLITNEVLNRFPWGVRVVQRRDELLGQRKSPRIF
ncbi:hypothetical protein EC957_010676 [Mortierella hygrophila]|uniref:RNI-like protein n=1 Tax=Mortierella hygrophila TaxID=979708 RepID=A0A9P6K4B7_9FUNG|nr:hypothetical protein EC957_010676 [Mortierella hygrophila]